MTRTALPALALVIVLTSFYGGWKLRQSGQLVIGEVETFDSRARRDTGAELLLVYVGSSTCAWSNDPRLPEAFSRIRTAVAAEADEGATAYAVMGVARDIRPSAGIDHLTQFGNFDEVTSGRGWLNLGVREYVFEGIPGPAATPQLLVVLRWVERSDRNAISSRELLVRKVGLSEILAWADHGSPLPEWSISMLGARK